MIIACVSFLLIVGIILAFLGGFGYLTPSSSSEFSESTDKNGCHIKENEYYLAIKE